MKQVLLSVPDVNYPFFMELIRNIDFVKIQEPDFDSSEEIKKNILQGAKELKKTLNSNATNLISLKDFLNEI
jgi:hypothetical protein